MATFRGRGLHQLAHCVHYLGFFYHKSAQKIGDGRSFQMRAYFSDQNGIPVDLRTFCDENTIRHVSSVDFESDGLPPLSDDIIGNIEERVNELSLPCHNKMGRFIHHGYQCPGDQGDKLPCSGDEEFRIMDNLEFIVDSAFWHWKKCQNSNLFKNHLKFNFAHSVAMVSYCIKGAEHYRNYNESSCTENGGPTSYCKRLERFRMLQSCFAEYPG